MFMRCCFWSQLSNFGTNFAATRLMPKSLIKIEWHEPIDMFRSSANSLTVIRRLANIIFSTSLIFSSVLKCSGVRHSLRRSHLLGHLRTFCTTDKRCFSPSSRSFSKSRSHNSSCEASAAEISFASVDERDTQPCFPVIHEMGFDPSRNKFPLSDFLSVLSLAQVASLYASSVGGFWLDMRSSSSLVVFRYLTILFAAFQSQFLGFWFLLLSMQTGAAISGLDTTLRANPLLEETSASYGESNWYQKKFSIDGNTSSRITGQSLPTCQSYRTSRLEHPHSSHAKSVETTVSDRLPKVAPLYPRLYGMAKTNPPSCIKFNLYLFVSSNEEKFCGFSGLIITSHNLPVWESRYDHYLRLLKFKSSVALAVVAFSYPTDPSQPSTSKLVGPFYKSSLDEKHVDEFCSDSGSEIDDPVVDPDYVEGLDSDETEIYDLEEGEFAQPPSKQRRLEEPQDEGWANVRNPSVNCPVFLDQPGPKMDFFTQTMSPYNIFKTFIDEEMYRKIKLETNKYARSTIDKQKKRGPLKAYSFLANWKAVSIAEIKLFFACIIHMCLVIKPRMKDYWATNSVLNTTFCKKIMARNRFEAIFGHDPLYKIRTFLDPLTKKFQCLYSPTQNLTIDEAICPFRGRIRFRIYIKGKPHKYGIKIYHICEANSGYTCDINIYTGPSQEEGYNSISNLVERLASHLFNRGHIIYCDRWFSLPHLFNYLWEKKTMAVGTVKTIRKGLPKNSFSKKLKKGEEMHLFKGSLMAMKWRHTRDVWMISTVHDHQMVEVMGRPGLSQAPIFKPQVVLDYNKNKIGVDRSDQMLSYYSFDQRTMKWWKKLFFHIYGLAIVNSCIIYNKLNPDAKMSLRDFHISICKALCSEANQDILDAQPSSGDQSDRLIGRHFIRRIKVEGKTYAQRRCKVCAEKGRVTSGKQARKDTAYECETCLVPLCLGDCFKLYHTIKDYYKV
ncbi:PGBD5 [Cordylochernes scorpioides]|uniref:PGBD5 n=1 Tax=Cordylochernes scorpioides TaxID=51811 RepID=A0ABY6LMC7_9ARAC|nr:PGBD5 [Cordylochernes scorpioides]